MANKKKKQTKRADHKRQERRFLAKSSTNPLVVGAAGAVAALLLGAGAWGYLFAKSFAEDEKLRVVPSYLVAAGAVVLGIVIWIGTSSEGTVRVGAPGIGLEKGDLRRMPWWAVETITFSAGALLVEGKDEAGAGWSLRLARRAHADAIAWIAKEALARIPKRVDLDDDARAAIGSASELTGQLVALEALQVVGKRCAASGKVISYEPDARVCERCERCYLKDALPKKCKCGASLTHLKPGAGDNDNDNDGDDVRTSGSSEAEAAAEQASS